MSVAWSSHRLQEFLAPEHTADLLLPAVVVQLLDARVRWIARDLLDAEVAVGNGRDLRQVRDRDHLCPFREAPQRLADSVGRLAADARVDLVEDYRLAAADGRDRQSDPGQLAARS